jgi:hypothetical protein
MGGTSGEISTISATATYSTAAQKKNPGVRPNEHAGASPDDPPAETDNRIIKDIGAGLDTACTYKVGGPLQIHIPVKRVVGDVGRFSKSDWSFN